MIFLTDAGDLFPHIPSPNLFKPQGFPPSSFHRSHKIVEGGRNHTKFPLSSGEEKHVDTYMVMNTRNKTKGKCSN